MLKFQKAKPANWVQNPTKKQMLTVILAVLTGSFLVIVAISDVFTVNPFQRKNLVLLLLMLPAVITCIRVCINYSTHQKKSNT